MISTNLSKQNMTNYYAVAYGRTPGIYTDWAKCFMNISGFSDAIFKKCKTMKDAEAFMLQHQTNKDTISKDTLYIYTDGSCINNGYRNAKAGIGIYFSTHDDRNTSEPFFDKPTNQRAELYAIIKAIQLVTEWEHNNKSIVIYTDSNYSIQCVTKWCKQWVKKNWKTRKNQNVKNKRLIQQLYALVEKNNITLRHIRSHTGNKDIHSIGNSYADKLALQGALQ